MILMADKNISLELIDVSHSLPIFEMVHQNRVNLRRWLAFVDKMETVAFAENFVKGSIKRNLDGVEYAFVIFQGDIAVGRIGVYKIDHQNKIGEIGYWLVNNAQGKGIMTIACKEMLRFCFDTLMLHRLEIKCGDGNAKSQAIAINLGFTCEGIIRDGECLHVKYIELYIYSLLRYEYHSLK